MKVALALVKITGEVDSDQVNQQLNNRNLLKLLLQRV